MRNHQLIRTLKELRGNPRACVYTEPLWGIPYNLYSPYASVFMLTLGISDSQIGLITSLGLVGQILWGLLAGAICDKLGRKRTTLIFDIISWSIPCLVWAVAQNFNYFLIAALINSVWRVTQTSWQCLLVEDADRSLLVDMYSWVYIAGLVVAFVSPLTGLLIGTFRLVPTIRGLYFLAFVMMTAKFFILNAMATETRQGRIRMEETKDQSFFSLLHGYWAIFKQILQSPATLFTAALMILLQIYGIISTTFLPILMTEKLHIPPEHLPLYHFTRSMTMLLFFFLVMPRLRSLEMRKPLLFGFAGLILTQLILIGAPVKGYIILLTATVLEGCSFPVATTLVDKLLVTSVDPKERARIMAILYVLVILCTSPFGWIAGQLSEANRKLPFVLNGVLFTLGFLLSLLTPRENA